MLKRRESRLIKDKRPFSDGADNLLTVTLLRMKRRFQTSSIIISTMFLFCKSISSSQLKPRCQTLSYAAVRLTNNCKNLLSFENYLKNIFYTKPIDPQMAVGVQTQSVV